MTRFRAEVAPAIVVQLLARELVSVSGGKTLNDVVAGAHEREIDLEHLGKRWEDQFQTTIV